MLSKGRTIEEIEATYDRLQEEADHTGDTFVVTQRLRLRPNERCACGSGRKWKKCCMADHETRVTIWPRGEAEPWRSDAAPDTARRVQAAALLAVIGGGCLDGA